MEELLRGLFGKYNPSIHDCIIAVNERGEGVLIKSEPSLFEIDLFDSCFLEDELTNKDEIPKTPGIYKCKIKAQTIKCNHPQDPNEWDVTISLHNIEQIQIEGL